MAVQANLRPTHYEKNLGAMKTDLVVNRITFSLSEANSGETFYLSVSKLNQNEVNVPGSLALRFNVTVSSEDNNFMVQNVSSALVNKFVVKFVRRYCSPGNCGLPHL